MRSQSVSTLGSAAAEGQANRLRAHVEALASIGPRNVIRYPALLAAADYCAQALAAGGSNVTRQEFVVGGRTVSNLEGEIRGRSRPEEIVVVGAHYDTVSGSPGANDNGSGVAATLELARLFAGRPLERTLRFVAFVNEEPPYFMTEAMGSVVYATRARQRGEKIVAMLSLETIGYYSEERGSQQYPSPFHLVLPSTGNFIAMVSNFGSAPLLRRVARAFRGGSPLRVIASPAPERIPGVGWSDHWSFWKQGYRAVMLTDTAPYRYPHYHTRDDTADKLDYPRMALVVSGVTEALRTLGN